jgi:hypothetical protein
MSSSQEKDTSLDVNEKWSLSLSNMTSKIYFTVEKIIPEQTGNLPNMYNKSGTVTPGNHLKNIENPHLGHAQLHFC